MKTLLELDEDEDSTNQNLLNTMETVLKGKFKHLHEKF